MCKATNVNLNDLMGNATGLLYTPPSRGTAKNRFRCPPHSTVEADQETILVVSTTGEFSIEQILCPVQMQATKPQGSCHC